MDDLRNRFARLGWRTLPNDWDGIVRRAEALAATTPVVSHGVTSVRRTAASAAPTSSWRLVKQPTRTIRVLLILALLVAAVAASLAAGGWLRDWQRVTLSSDPPPSAPPFISQVQDCAGSRSREDLVETHLGGNAVASWAIGGEPSSPAPGELAAARLDSLQNVGVNLVDPATGGVCRLVDLRHTGLLPWELRWSPDGGALAVTNQLWAGSGETHLLVWSAGGDSAALTRPWIGTELPGLAWSPDGATIALAGGRAITFLRADGGQPQVLACDACRSPTRVSWSPDGAFVAVRTPSTDGPIGTTEIHLADVRNGTVSRLDTGSDRLDLVAWIETDTLLVIDHATDSLLEVPVARPDEFTVLEAVRLDDGAAYLASPDLALAVFVADQGRSEERLVVLDLGDNTRTTVARTADLERGLPIGDVVWSPDSRSLAFTQVRSGEEGLSVATTIWLVDADGGDLRQLVRGPFNLLDGRSIGSGADGGAWRADSN